MSHRPRQDSSQTGTVPSTGRRIVIFFLVVVLHSVVLVPLTSGWDPLRDDPEREYDRHAKRAVRRDAFPVFNNPRMVSRERADRRMRPNEWVIGISLNGDDRAYPVEVMGVHELGNDTVGGEPITVCW